MDRIKEEILFCAPLGLYTRKIDVFQKVNAFFKSKEVNLEWRNGVSGGGAPSMLKRVNGFAT